MGQSVCKVETCGTDTRITFRGSSAPGRDQGLVFLSSCMHVERENSIQMKTNFSNEDAPRPPLGRVLTSEFRLKN